MSTSPQDELARGALDGKELFTIEGSKNWRSTPGQPEEREKWRKMLQKKPFTAAMTAH